MDQDNTAVITPWGLFKFTRVPFGISTAPAVYQDRMANVILKELYMKGCVAYIDDTVIFGKTTVKILDNLEAVFIQMVKHNVRLKGVKCSFGYSEVAFVGHLFNSKGYHMSEERKQGIQDMARPISLKQLRSFLGMVNYFRDFIPHISTVLAPLTDLTCVSKHKEFVWNEDAERTFIEIKKLIINSTSLTHLTDSGVITLYTDASMMGIGAVLVQADENNVDHPILFLSQKFSSAKCYAGMLCRITIEQECYAVYYSIITLQSYLLGRHFFVATDHRNLMYLEKSVVTLASTPT